MTRHSTPSEQTVALPALDDDVLGLYGPDDSTQARDLAAAQPERLKALRRLFLIEATSAQVLRLDDRRSSASTRNLAGRPQLIRGARQQAAVRGDRDG